MKRTHLNALLLKHVLAMKPDNSALIDLLETAEIEHNVELRNVSARMHPYIADQIDELAELLGMSKRRFIEASIIEGIRQAWALLEEEGVAVAGEVQQENEKC